MIDSQSTPLLSGSNVTVCSPDGEKILLRDLYFAIYPGDFIVLLGNNGSGKSSLMKLFNGIYEKSAGTLSFQGKHIERFALQKETSSIATLTQDVKQSTFGSLTIWENILLFAPKNSFLENQNLYRFSCRNLDFQTTLKEAFAKECPQLMGRLSTRTEQLSGGERQMLALFLVLLRPPKLLLLDEHTSALDPVASDKVMQQTQKAIKSHGITAIMTTHHIEHALNYGNRIWILHQGCFQAEIQNKQELTKEALLQKAYG